jgi:energy-converting hydrogenase Eha subunit H
MPVVHRIVDLTGESVTTRGDANNMSDEPIPITAVKGEVIGAIPWVGNVVWALKSPVAVLIMLAAAVLMVEWSFRTGKAEKEAEKEKLKAEIRALMDELKED